MFEEEVMKHFAKLIAIALVALLFSPGPAQAGGSNAGSSSYLPCKFALIASKGTSAVVAYSALTITTDPDTLDETYAEVIVVKTVSSKGSITSTRTLALLPTELLTNSDGCVAVVATSGYFYIAAGLTNAVQDDPTCVPDYDVDPPVDCPVTVTEYLQFWRSSNGTSWSRVGRLAGLGATEIRVAAIASTVLVVAGISIADPECVPGGLDENGNEMECEPDRLRLDVFESTSASMAFGASVTISSDAEMSDGYMSAEFSGGSVGILTWRNVNGEYMSATRKGSRSWYTATKIANSTSGYAGSSASVGKSAIVAYVDDSLSKLSWRMSTNSGKTWATQKKTASLVTGDVYSRNAWVVGSKFYVAVDRVPWEGSFYSSVYQISASSAVRKFTVSANESITGAVAIGARTILITRYQVGQTYYLRLYSFV